MPLGTLVKLERREFHHAVLLGAVGQVDALVDGQAGNLPQVVVRVGADGTDAIRAEVHGLGLAVVNLEESFLAM